MRALPIGTVRRRKAGIFEKLAVRIWVRRRHLGIAERDALVAARFAAAGKPIGLLLSAARMMEVGPEPHGVAKLARDIIAAAYNGGPDVFHVEQIERFTNAFRDMLNRTRERPKVVPLKEAMAEIRLGGADVKWREYAARASALVNGGQVDMVTLHRHAIMARAHVGGRR